MAKYDELGCVYSLASHRCTEDCGSLAILLYMDVWASSGSVGSIGMVSGSPLHHQNLLEFAICSDGEI